LLLGVIQSNFSSARPNIRIIIPIIHFLITFVFERNIFIHSDNFRYLTTIPKNDYISDTAELIITYILSRLACLFIIFLFWKIVYIIIDKKIEKNDLILLGFIYVMVLVAGLVIFPDLFGLAIDNYMNYSMAIRFIPTYWQSIFTGALYAGCLMFIPHPISLFIIQWSFLFLTISFMYLKTKTLFPVSYYRFIPFALLLLPDTYYLIFNSYRNNYYTTLVLFYISFLYFKFKTPNCEDRIKDFLFVSILSSFIMVWRSEGILIGAGGILLYLIYTFKNSKRKTQSIIFIVIASLVSFLGFRGVQNIGESKYYGQDYMIYNTTNVLYRILNNPNSNLYYSTAQADFDAIDHVIPIQAIKESGTTGYRNYNYSQGHLDFNQTLAANEASDAYMKAYYSIVIHNIGPYLDTQFSLLFDALGVNHEYATIYDYNGEIQTNLNSFVYDQWLIGLSEMNNHAAGWNNIPLRHQFSVLIQNIISVYRDLIIYSGINLILKIGTLLTCLLILLKEILYSISQRDSKQIGFIFALSLLFVFFVAVTLVIPEGKQEYYYPVFYSGYTLIYLYGLSKKELKSQS